MFSDPVLPFQPWGGVHADSKETLIFYPTAGNCESQDVSHRLCPQATSVWLWLWRVVVRTSWSVGKPGQRGLWVMVGCAAGPLPPAVVVAWWSGLPEGSVKSTSFHWWLESETVTERRDSDVSVGLKLGSTGLNKTHLTQRNVYIFLESWFSTASILNARIPTIWALTVHTMAFHLM